MHSRKTSMLLLVSSGHYAVLGSDALSQTPQRGQLDFIDAISPRVPLRQGWFVQPVSQLQFVQFGACEAPHFRERFMGLAQHVVWKYARQVRTEHAIVVVLIA